MEELLPPSTKPPSGGPWSGLNIAQTVFVVYIVFIHTQMFAFTIRLGLSLFNITKETRQAINRRLIENDPKSSFMASSRDLVSRSQSKGFDLAEIEVGIAELIHAIILPNYCEDLHTLETTLKVLASHPRAKSQYEIYLAMEQNENLAVEKASRLVSSFENSFLNIQSTFHPAGIQGEIAGKSSNVSFAARKIAEIYRESLQLESCKVMVTVMDADTHLSRDYFTEIRRLHYLHMTEADRSIYCCPIIFDRNSHESPILVRCADLLWGFAGLSTMYPYTIIAIPTSVYSLPLSLVEKVGGWDSDPTAIGEDLHMLLKCYFETAGNLISRVVYIPASQCNVSSDAGIGWRRTVDTCIARYRQALRHMWGSLDSGFAARRTFGYLSFTQRCLLLRPRHFALLHLLWEAHFMPCHLTLLMFFSVFYTLWTPVASLHPTLAWAFSFTNTLRTSGFLGMNVCLSLYERWHAVCLDSRMKDMREANLPDTGFSRRVWYHPQCLCERVCFPLSGTMFGAVPTIHAVFSHFWTDRLVYRVSKKPTFSVELGAF
ncbi:uncharacterized protein N7511_000094 [Penicillium nucicola]|uniref:uncharacterized protein n=1 Tax=Penicillium nucicola TaxID=1850975 RepID=UPI00254568B3|nr:uncharacterized protein N7511_000094 [Penicillium nucicola]KAJ5775083.1 hypothetical protein N7511_000094 [Penicillium nucicola]